ncbi:MAG: 16S rRNA (cytosine(1402)-N(4))-methyltransferase RsmH, partial [Patescibacteria group bacterium]
GHYPRQIRLIFSPLPSGQLINAHKHSMTQVSRHRSVLTAEVLELIQPKSGGIYLDGTFGGGGHAQALLDASAPRGKMVAIDRDAEVKQFAKPLAERYGRRFSFEVLRYDQAEKLELLFDGVLLDLGLSSDQLEESGRGFSYARNEPLDMRFDARQGQTASQLLSQTTPQLLERIFRDYGEDRHGGQLARKIVARRRQEPIRTTFDLIGVIGTTQPKVLSKIFQALRIAVNDELTRLSQGLTAVTNCLKPDGVLAVISFHSLEDRIVKEFVRNHLEIITKKPIIATDNEILNNPRARSAKLRAGKKR